MPLLLQINATANVTSTGRIAEGIGSIAMADGFDSVIAYGRLAAASRSTLLRIGSQRDIIAHGLATRMSDRHGLASARATRAFLDEVGRMKPDIIHLHNIHGYYINYPILFDFLARSGIPVVWTMHDCWAVTGHCTHFALAGCGKWKTHCFKCPQTHVYPASMFIDRSHANFEAKRAAFTSVRNMTIVAVSGWLAEIMADSFLSHHPIITIRNGIDTGTFSPQPEKAAAIRTRLGIRTEEKIVLGIANVWNRAKGLDDFMKLGALLPPDVRIVLAGLTSRQIAHLPSNIIGLGYINDKKELAGLYSSAAAYVNPTMEDSYPTTNLEATACGTPVITYRTGGSPESISNGTGIVVEQGDVTAIADAIAEILHADRYATAAACRRHAIENFDEQQNFKAYTNLYRRLLNL